MGRGQAATDHAAGGVDDIEAPVEDGWQFVHVGADEGGGKLELGGQGAGQLDRLVGEVDPGHPGAQPGPGQGVDPVVALQVQQGLPGDLADLGDFIRPAGGSRLP